MSSASASENMIEHLSIFERAVIEAKTTNDFLPVWNLFINTRFFVIVKTDEKNSTTNNFVFSIFNSQETKDSPMVLVSEKIERLENPGSNKAIQVTGAELVKMLNPEVGIMVGTADGGLGIPKHLVQWIKNSITTVH